MTTTSKDVAKWFNTIGREARDKQDWKLKLVFESLTEQGIDAAKYFGFGISMSTLPGADYD